MATQIPDTVPTPGPVLRKAAVVVLVSLLLLIPIGMLRGLISERIRLADQAGAAVAAGWGGWQQLGGPILVVPIERQIRDGHGQPRQRLDYVFILPDTLDIDAALETESRRRGIYTVPVYQSRLRIEARFVPADLAAVSATGHPDRQVLWDKAQLLLPVSDVKAIRALEQARWNDRPLRFVGGGYPQHDGIRAAIDLSEVRAGKPALFTAELSVAGSECLQFLPLARTTDVRMQADWPDPAFSGNYLPVERHVVEDGFTARWQVLELNRDFPQSWTDEAAVTHEQFRDSAFGVGLYLPADVYQRNERSMKYALLFIVMTFSSLFLLEHLVGPELHAVQYALVGLALSMFFLLLLALSEHIGFDAAYWVGTAALVSLIGVYLSGVLRSRARGCVAAVAMTLLYGLLYVILNAAETALLIGAMSLFAMLTAVMTITRRVDWNAIGRDGRARSAPDDGG